MDSFTSTVIAGLVIILGLIIVFNGFACEGPSCFWYSPQTTTTVKTIANMSGELIGLQETESLRPIHIGDFNVSYNTGQMVRPIQPKNIYNGLLFGSDNLKVKMTIPPDAVGNKIEFDIGTTNLYGAVEIKLNNVTLEKKPLETGHHSIILPDDKLYNENIIEFIPESSYWRLWAPTYYEISNISLISDTVTFNGFETYFTIYQEEFEKLNNGRLDLLFAQMQGRMTVEVNGNNVFDGIPERNEVLNIDKSLLKTGVNKFVIKAKEDGSFDGNALLVLEGSEIVNKKLEHLFNISTSEYNMLGIGYVEFDITGVVKQGDVIVQLNDKTICYTENNCRPTVDLGHYRFAFNQSDVDKGRNKLTIQGYAGLFTVDNVAVNV